MGDIVDDFEAEMEVALMEYLSETLPDPVSDQLAIGEGGVGGTVHGAEVVLALRCGEGGAGQFTIGRTQAVTLHNSIEDFQIVSGNLVSEATRAAVYHDADLVWNAQTKSSRGLGVENVLWRNYLNLKIMVPGTQGAKLGQAATECLG